MTVSVLGVTGSPRRGGNSETILDEVLRGATEAGASTAKVILAEKDVKPCRACNACARSHSLPSLAFIRLSPSRMSSFLYAVNLVR